MPTLDRRLLAWIYSDTDGDDQPATPPASHLAVDAASYYDRCGSGAPASVDDVLVVPGEDDAGPSSSSGARKACAAAGLVAVGCLGAYLAWRYCATTGLADCVVLI